MNKMQLTVGDSTVEVEAGAGSVIQQRLTTLDSTIADKDATIAQLTKQRDTAMAERDTAREELETSKQLVADSADIPKLYAARRKLLANAALVLDEEALSKVDDCSDLDVRKAVIVAASPEGEKALLDDKGNEKSEEYIEARFDSLVELKRQSNSNQLSNALAAPLGVHPGGVPGPAHPTSSVSPKKFSEALDRLDSQHTQNRGGLRAS